MTTFNVNGQQRILTLVGAAVLSLGLVMPALADNTVTTTVTGGVGTRTASIADRTLGSVPYSNLDQTQTGSLTLTAEDASGTGLGWNVTVLASNFVPLGAGTAIPAANFSLTSAATPVKTSG